MERVTGIGGVFLRARDAAGLGDWYARHLGVELEDYGGTTFRWRGGETTVWSLFPHDTDYFGSRRQDAMVNFRVEEHEYGRFGWAVDPEGNRFELWQPPPGS